MLARFVLSAALCAAFAARLAAADPAFTNAKEAGLDFAIQGEYLAEQGDKKLGAQVVALGDGKFDVVGYLGGFPGEGWKRGDDTKRGTGELKDGVAEFKGDDWTATIKDGVFTVRHGDQAIEFKKV